MVLFRKTVFPAKRQQNPKKFERKEALRKRGNFINDVLTTQELLVAIQDAKQKAKEAKDTEGEEVRI